MADRVIHWALTDLYDTDPKPDYALSVCWRWLPVKKYLGEVEGVPGFGFSTVEDPEGEMECILCRNHTHERIDAVLNRHVDAPDGLRYRAGG